MFHSGRRSNQDRNKNQGKFLDPKRDTHTRLKALRNLYEMLSDQELKIFFGDYSTEIFFVFYEEFTNLELSGKTKGTRLKDELEDLLLTLEKLFLYSPDKIHQKWQFNGIGQILRKLLHYGNILLIREIGIRLFILWLHILQENVNELNLAIYGSIIPGFPTCIDKIDISKTHRNKDALEYLISCVNGQSTNQSYFITNMENEKEWCIAEGCYPICPPQQYEKLSSPDELTRRFLDVILDHMTKRMLDIHWKEKHMKQSGFFYLFSHLKRFYLPLIFPQWNPKDHLYREIPEIINIPIQEDKNSGFEGSLAKSTDFPSVTLACQRALLSWVILFNIKLRRKGYSSSDQPVEGASARVPSNESMSDLNSAVDENSTHTSVSDIPRLMPRSKNYEILCSIADIVKSVLFTTQENVTVLHEIFRQCFLLPLNSMDKMNDVLNIYKEWFFKIQDRPQFMLEPKKPSNSISEPENCAENSPLLRTPSYKEAVTSYEQVFFPNIPVQNVQAGFQPNLRLFITITAQLFFEKQNKDGMSKHADICKRIMKIYRNIVLEVQLDSITWRQLLTALLKIADNILSIHPPTPRHSTLGGQLASYLLQTLFVTWVRASLQVYLEPDLWNELLRVCSTFSSWEEVVEEWAGTMKTLTRVLARNVYNIDLQAPPLEQLTVRDKVKMKRKITEPSSNILQKETGSHNQYQGNRKLLRQEHISRPDDSSVLPSAKSVIPRSASEPGLKASPKVVRNIVSMHSDSEFSKNSNDMDDNSRFDRGEMRSTVLKQKEEEEEEGREGEQLEVKKSRFPCTLAELADNKFLTQSFDSVSSDTNSVFFNSLNINNTTQHNNMTQHNMFSNITQYDTLIPAVNVEHFSDTESDETTNGVITYEMLKDTNTNSDSSSTNMPLSLSYGSINSCLNESSQNLLAEFEYDGENDDIEEAKVGALHPVIKSYTEKVETESYVTGSDSASFSDDPNKAVSVSSEMDLMSFGSDGHHVSKVTLDSHSIDSRMFTLIEDDNYPGLKSPGSSSVGGIMEEAIADDVSYKTSHVHFAEGTSSDKIDSERKISDWRRATDHSMCSVIEGGNIGGWSVLSAVILWRRFLGILGNVNEIRDPSVHASVFKHLIQIWKDMEAIKRNQGISLDNKSTPEPPEITPPLFFCSSWCFQAMSLDLPATHKDAKVLAYKLICMMTMKSHGLIPSSDHMAHFYHHLHIGLTGEGQDVINAIIEECPLFFSSEFQSCSCLILDFICGATAIISTQYMAYPRKEAISLLGSLICLPGVYPSLRIYQPVCQHDLSNVSFGKEIREKLLTPLLRASKNDPSCHARCIALDCLGLFIVESLVHLGGHPKIYECLTLLISSLEFHSQVVSTVALDVLWTLSFYYEHLYRFDRELPLRIIEAICHVTFHLQSARKTSISDLSSEEEPEYMSRVLLCLLDWCMVMPREMMLKSRTSHDAERTYLGLVMKIFKKCSENKDEVLSLERTRSLNISQIFLGESRQIRLARVHNDLNVHDQQDDETDFLGDVSHTNSDVLHSTAQYAISEILNYYQHFPLETGAVRQTSMIVESDEHPIGMDDLNSLLDSNNVQFVLLNDTTLLSVVELPQACTFSENTGLEGPKTISRFIIRDQSGKHCWDFTDMFTKNKEIVPSKGDRVNPRSASLIRKHSRNLSVSNTRTISSSSTALPTWQSVDQDTDRVDQLLRYIGESSPECLLFADQKLNIPAPVPSHVDSSVQSSVVTSVLKQHNEEENYVHEISHDPRITASEIFAPEYSDPISPYHVSKMLLHQLGFFSSHKRNKIELLERNERLLRDIRNLDNQPCRETQKIAVFYIAAGQEDKQSILSNSKASVKFEEFLSGMAWEVDLATHTGFMGGLEKNLSTGKTAPYFATHSLEVMFHVSTRMAGSDEEQLKTKLRHLGNDEVHIVWSEHNRDFRRGIINTEFGDVLLIVYPLEHNLYRIQINCKPKIPPFGPLFDGAMVDGSLLPLLVRSTAINAGRAKRSTLPYYKRHYEERARCIKEVLKNRVRQTTFEEFVCQLFSPGQQETLNRNDSCDGVHRTFSAPSRSSTMGDPAAVLKLLDMTGTFRVRTVSAAVKYEDKFHRAASYTSLNNEDTCADLEPKEFKERRKSITKLIRKKASSVDVPFGISEKNGE